jgi:hypothetical protein
VGAVKEEVEAVLDSPSVESLVSFGSDGWVADVSASVAEVAVLAMRRTRASILSI